jgi:hypothetical protein
MGAMEGGVDLGSIQNGGVLLQMRSHAIEMMGSGSRNTPTCGADNDPGQRLENLHLYFPDHEFFLRHAACHVSLNGSNSALIARTNAG